MFTHACLISRSLWFVGRDIEMQIMKHFPGVPMFVEKPTATGPADEIAEVYKVAKEISNTRTIVSVG
jgi:hypothetical protein